MWKQYEPIVPQGLMTLLTGYCRAYMRKKPDDMNLFAMYYCMELKKYKNENPTYQAEKLIREFHKHRVDKLCGTAYEEEVLKLGYKATSKENLTFNMFEIVLKEHEMWGRGKERTPSTAASQETHGPTALAPAVQHQVSQALMAAVPVGGSMTSGSSDPGGPSIHNAISKVSSEMTLTVVESRTDVVPIVGQNESSEFVSRSSSQTSTSSQAPGTQHCDEEGCSCASMSREMVYYPTGHSYMGGRFPGFHPAYLPPAPPFIPPYVPYPQGPPPCMCHLQRPMCHAAPVPQCHAAPMPAHQCAHYQPHISPAANCPQMAPCNYMESSYPQLIPVPRFVMASPYNTSFHYRQRPRTATGVSGSRSEELTTSGHHSCTSSSCHMSDSAPSGPEPAHQPSYRGQREEWRAGNANLNLVYFPEGGPHPAGALRSPTVCPQRRDAQVRPCSAPTKRTGFSTQKGPAS